LTKRTERQTKRQRRQRVCNSKGWIAVLKIQHEDKGHEIVVGLSAVVADKMSGTSRVRKQCSKNLLEEKVHDIVSSQSDAVV
jgi:hypothetical protein